MGIADVAEQEPAGVATVPPTRFDEAPEPAREGWETRRPDSACVYRR